MCISLCCFEYIEYAVYLYAGIIPCHSGFCNRQVSRIAGFFCGSFCRKRRKGDYLVGVLPASSALPCLRTSLFFPFPEGEGQPPDPRPQSALPTPGKGEPFGFLMQGEGASPPATPRLRRNHPGTPYCSRHRRRGAGGEAPGKETKNLPLPRWGRGSGGWGGRKQHEGRQERAKAGKSRRRGRKRVSPPHCLPTPREAGARRFPPPTIPPQSGDCG